MKSNTRSTHPSSPSLLARFFVASLLFALGGCGEDPSVPESVPVSEERDLAGSRPIRDGRLDRVRSRAEEAFAEERKGFAKSETRVGPQPWPEDLPGRWPLLSAATVVADTQHATGDRLLLVNLPGAPDHALDDYREALRANGYRVDVSEASGSPRALHVRNAEHEAILTFVAREKVTRVEILFLSRAAG